MKKWLMNVLFFLIAIGFMFIVDGTSLVDQVPLGDFGERILEIDLFTKWINLYETSFFNAILLIGLLHIILFPVYGLIFKRTH